MPRIWTWVMGFSLTAGGGALLLQVFLGHAISSILWRTPVVMLGVGWGVLASLTLTRPLWMSAQAGADGPRAGTPVGGGRDGAR